MLSARDGEILAALVEGLSNKEIAVRLNVPETTVKSGIQILLKKAGVRTRASLVRVAIENRRPLPDIR